MMASLTLRSLCKVGKVIQRAKLDYYRSYGGYRMASKDYRIRNETSMPEQTGASIWGYIRIW